MTEDLGYYQNQRPEVAALVSPEAKTILDVGCGSGALGQYLKQSSPGRTVCGIEYVESVGSQAVRVLDQVVIGDVQNMNIPFQPNYFDTMIFADVLEHLIDPAAVLVKLRPFLKPAGEIVTSIPNMRHYTVIWRLIKEGWKYDEFGLFDKTHFRFFSLPSMTALLEGAGYRVERVTPRIAASKKMVLLNKICFGKLEEFVAFQYLFKARKK